MSHLFYPPFPKQNPNNKQISSRQRREFLKWQMGWAASIALSIAGWPIIKPAAAADAKDIAIATGEPGPATRAAVKALGGMQTFVKPGAKVVIKPNMSFPHGPEEATNTHPEVVREIVAMCKEAQADRIRVLDHPLRQEELCIEGVKKACDIFDEDIVHGLTDYRFFKEVEIKQGKDFRKTDLMNDVIKADVLIAAPVAKSHSSAGVSLSMKGMMGLIYNRSIMHRSFDLHEAIVDLATLCPPQLVIVDGTRVLSTNGPSGPGKVLQMDTVIASADMVAADAQSVSLFEWYSQKLLPNNVKHIRLAHERGLGRMDIENLKVHRVAA